jgi:hypothetical protein
MSLVLHNGQNGVMNQTGNSIQHAPQGAGRQPEQPTTRSKPVGDSVAAVAVNHIDATNRVFGQYVAECNRTASQYTPEGQQARLQAFQNTEAFKGIDAHVAAVDSHIEQLEQQREAVRRSLAPEWGSTGEGDRARAWNRNKAIFDSSEGGKLASRVQQAIANAEPAERAVLIEEAPAYLESRGLPASFIEPTVAQVAPQLAAVDAELKRARIDQQKVKYNANTVKNAVAAGRPATTVVGI